MYFLTAGQSALPRRLYGDDDISPAYLSAIEELVLAAQPEDRYFSAIYAHRKMQNDNPLKKWALETAIENIPFIPALRRQDIIDTHLKNGATAWSHFLTIGQYKIDFLYDYPDAQRAIPDIEKLPTMKVVDFARKMAALNGAMKRQPCP
jgi:hypothetical protein